MTGGVSEGTVSQLCACVLEVPTSVHGSTERKHKSHREQIRGEIQILCKTSGLSHKFIQREVQFLNLISSHCWRSVRWYFNTSSIVCNYMYDNRNSHSGQHSGLLSQDQHQSTTFALAWSLTSHFSRCHSLVTSCVHFKSLETETDTWQFQVQLHQCHCESKRGVRKFRELRTQTLGTCACFLIVTGEQVGGRD